VNYSEQRELETAIKVMKPGQDALLQKSPRVSRDQRCDEQNQNEQQKAHDRDPELRLVYEIIVQYVCDPFEDRGERRLGRGFLLKNQLSISSLT
jgi:hypothetical protein